MVKSVKDIAMQALRYVTSSGATPFHSRRVAQNAMDEIEKLLGDIEAEAETPFRAVREEISSTHATEPRFWLVWTERGSNPSYKHHSRDSALAECARLAAHNMEVKFYVVAVTGYVVNVPPKPEPKAGLQYHWMTRDQL